MGAYTSGLAAASSASRESCTCLYSSRNTWLSCSAPSPIWRRLELGGEPLGARFAAGKKPDERARRLRHRAVRHHRPLVRSHYLQQLRHGTRVCQIFALRDFADVVQPHLHFAIRDQLLARSLPGNDLEPRFERIENPGLNEDPLRLFPALVR